MLFSPDLTMDFSCEIRKNYSERRGESDANTIFTPACINIKILPQNTK